MKRLFLWAGILSLALVAGGCRRGAASPQEILDGTILPVRFSLAVNPFQTKATDTSLEDGDVLGIFALDPIGARNVRATVSGTALTPEVPVRWVYDQKANTTFLAYAPYDASVTGTSLDFAVKADQSSYSGYAASDLLAASATAAPRTQVSLNLRHQLSKLVLNVTCEDAAEQVASVTLGELVLNASVDIAAKTVTPGSDKGIIAAGRAVEANGGTGFAAIIVPQTVRIPLSVTTVSGRKVEFVLDEVASLASGFAYKADIVVPASTGPSTGEAIGFSISVQPWSDGGSLNYK